MLPEDVLLVHVFPRLPIDTRMALGVPPGRLDLTRFDNVSLAFADRGSAVELKDGDPCVMQGIWGADLTLEDDSWAHLYDMEFWPVFMWIDYSRAQVQTHDYRRSMYSSPLVR